MMKRSKFFPLQKVLQFGLLRLHPQAHLVAIKPEDLHPAPHLLQVRLLLGTATHDLPQLLTQALPQSQLPLRVSEPGSALGLPDPLLLHGPAGLVLPLAPCLLARGQVVERFRVYLTVFFMDEHVAALHDRVEVHDLGVVVVLLVEVHVVYLVEGVLPDVLIEDVALVATLAHLHRPVHLSEQLSHSLLLLALQVGVVLLLKLLTRLQTAHPPPPWPFGALALFVFVLPSPDLALNLRLDALEQFIEGGHLFIF